jgi:type 1 glutamine amidotransferase
MKRIVLALATSCFAFCAFAASDWQPVFDDKPVPETLAQAIEAALPTEAIVPPQRTRRILVYSVTAGFRHASIPTGKVALARLGESTGAFDAVVSDDFANFEPEVLKTFDSVVLLNTTQDFFMPNKKKQGGQFTEEEWTYLQAQNDRLVDNLVDYVNEGGGLVGIHAATDSCYGHEAYGETIGAYFWGHPWNANMNVTIRVEDPEHAIIKPVFEGIKDFRIKEEIYQFKPEPYSRERLRILLNLDPERSDKPKQEPRREDGDFPVCWVQRVGQGRVFYTSLGHNHHIYSNPLMLKHYLAGIQFAVGDLEADMTPSAQIELPNFR